MLKMADVAVPIPIAPPHLPTPTGAKAEVGAAPATPSSASNTTSTPDIAFLDTPLRAPFDAIGQLFDHLRANPAAAEALNATYPTRGVFKAAAVRNGSSDQKLTVDLSPSRLSGVPDALRAALAPPRLRPRARVLRGAHGPAPGFRAGRSRRQR